LNKKSLLVDPEIRKAYTLSTIFYTDQDIYHQSKDLIFAKSWQMAGLSSAFQKDWNAIPVQLLPGFLDEPLLMVKSEKNISVYSNVCTHRGNLLVTKPEEYSQFVCRYHGRCFTPAGKFKSMPAFEEAENFPSRTDHLPCIDTHQLGPLVFTRLDPGTSFEKVYGPMLSRLNWFQFDQLTYKKELSRTYKLDAHWALYCENYLEGFHIPFVHETLNKIISYADYQTDLYDYANVQIGIAKPGEAQFNLPKGSMDFGKQIFAYYWWFYPNIMINVYTWGVSLNVIRPVSFKKTEIDFMTFVLPGIDSKPFKETALHLTEMEDEEIVLQVQKGVRSRFYQKGRFSPTMEKGVHHFQSLVASHMQET
jgi:choline monooxygenase